MDSRYMVRVIDLGTRTEIAHFGEFYRKTAAIYEAGKQSMHFGLGCVALVEQAGVKIIAYRRGREVSAQLELPL